MRGSAAFAKDVATRISQAVHAAPQQRRIYNGKNETVLPKSSGSRGGAAVGRAVTGLGGWQYSDLPGGARRGASTCQGRCTREVG